MVETEGGPVDGGGVLHFPCMLIECLVDQIFEGSGRGSVKKSSVVTYAFNEAVMYDE